MSRHTVRTEVSWLAQRWKAVAATVLPLVGGLLVLVSTDSFDFQHVVGVIATALVSGGVTHQVPNAGVAPVQDTVDAVLSAVPPTIVPAVAQAVTETTTGVLATAVGTVAALPGVVIPVAGGLAGTVEDAVGSAFDDSPPAGS